MRLPANRGQVLRRNSVLRSRLAPALPVFLASSPLFPKLLAPSSWAGLKKTGPGESASSCVRATVVMHLLGKPCSHRGMMLSGLTDRSAHGRSNKTPMVLTLSPE